MIARALALAVLLAPASGSAHGGEPRVVDLLFPAAGETPWVVVDRRGVFALGSESARARWLCDDALVPEPGLYGLAITEDAWVAASKTGVLRSTDEGCSFAAVPGALEAHLVGRLDRHPQRTSEVLTSTSTSDVVNDAFLSEDGGQTWTAAGIPTDGRVRSFVRSPADPEVVYLTATDGVFRSDDGGRSFAPIGLGPGDEVLAEEFRILAGDPVDPQTAWAVVERFPDSIVARTEDGGQSWRQMLVLPDAPESLVTDATGTRVLLATPFEGLYRSEDAGDNWSAVPLPDPRLVIGCLRREPGTDVVWACGRSQLAQVWALASSPDLGDTWRPEMLDFAIDADEWGCAADAPSTLTCQALCPPGDPNCASGPADAGSPDVGVDDAADMGTSPSLDAGPPAEEDTGGGESGCDTTGGPAWMLALLALAVVRRRD